MNECPESPQQLAVHASSTPRDGTRKVTSNDWFRARSRCEHHQRGAGSVRPEQEGLQWLDFLRHFSLSEASHFVGLTSRHLTWCPAHTTHREQFSFHSHKLRYYSSLPFVDVSICTVQHQQSVHAHLLALLALHFCEISLPSPICPWLKALLQNLAASVSARLIE